MFRSFIYLDTDALNRYAQQLELGYRTKIESAKVGAAANFGVANAKVELEGTPSQNNVFSLYDKLERKIEKLQGNEYFDFLSGDFDESTIPPMSLMRFNGNASILEAFDLMNTLKTFAPLLNAAGQLNESNTEIPNELILNLLNRENAQIPLLIDGLSIQIYSKLKTRFIIDGDVSAIEDLEDEEVAFLCKVESHVLKDKVVVYDPLKDFMKLGRALRRNIKRTPELEEVIVPGPALKVELIAIYH